MSSPPSHPPIPSYRDHLADGAALYCASFAAGLKPEPELDVADWAAEKRIVAPEASAFPGPWDRTLAPFANEIMNCLSAHHPAESVTLMKSAQVTGTEIGTNWLGSIIDQLPGPTMVIHPTVEAAKAWVKEKLNPTIEVTPCLRRKIAAQRNRSASGSTGMFKKFAGGFITITGANSAAGLRQHSIRFLFKDDLDQWPQDVDDQGDPENMADARQMAFHEAGTAKEFKVSTPTIKRLSRIERAYEASDKRIWKVPCPDCGHEQELTFKNLRFETTPPHNPEYQCAACGVLIAHYQKRAMNAKGRWVATAPGAGKQPGFRLNTLVSPFTTWEKMVKAFIAAKDQPRKLKGFVNLWLGETWEERGDAPEWSLLFKRRETYTLGTLPPGALIITAGVDVQKDYLQYEVIGWGIGKTSWSIDTGIIEGDTASSAPWIELDGIYNRQYEDWQGRNWAIDMMAVDSGYNTHMVYAWCRGRNRAMAVKGMPGHLTPALGLPTKQDVTYAGKRRRRSAVLWPVGTWVLKSEIYGNLRKDPPAAGAECFPIGYCHFSTAHDERFFQQLTAESLVTRERGGRRVTEWVASGENHALDCRVYALAAAEHLGLARWTFKHWQQIVADRGAPPEQAQLDLAQLWAVGIEPAAAPPADQAPMEEPQANAVRPGENGAGGAPSTPRIPSPAKPITDPQMRQ